MSELLNRTIGGYQLLERIGGGGVAEVYRARQAGGAREAVVKIIYPEFARQPGVARNFAHITRMAAQLASHPHILPVIGSGEDGDYLYLVSPLVKDGTLADWLNKGGRLGVSDVAPFFQQLCGALSYAHSLGVTHGNLKPSNIYLFEGRHILIGDFGMLWDVTALDPTWAGSGVEAFEYIAPEVFAGQVSQYADIYSLGATLFATLTGRPPFHANKLSELITASQQTLPPSLAAAVSAPPPGVAALDVVVRQAMAKRPEERYPSAVALAQAVETMARQAAAAPQSVSQANPLPSPPLAPAPLSGGVFGVPPQPAPPPPAAAPDGTPGAPLAQLDPPFPPLPPMAQPDAAMEQGGPALNAQVPGAFGAPPTQRVADPLAESMSAAPTERFPAPFAPSVPSVPSMPTEGLVNPLAGPPSVRLAPSDPLQEPEALRYGPPVSEEGPGAWGEAPDGFAESDIQPFDEASGGDFYDADASQSGQFSATELGLPRLTNPALGNLPPDWKELVNDESARKRHDPFASSEPPPRAGVASGRMRDDPPDGAFDDRFADSRDGAFDDRFADSRDGAFDDRFAASRDGAFDDRFAASRDGAFDDRFADPHYDAMPSTDPRGRAQRPTASEDRRPWEEEPLGSFSPVGAGVRADYDIDHLTSDGPAAKRRGSQDLTNDTLQAQRVWTNSHLIVRGKRRSKKPLAVIASLVLLTALEMMILAVMRPDICVTHTCAVLEGYVQRAVPNVHIPGATAPVTLSPEAPQISVVTDTAGKTSVTLTNTSADPITWRADTTLAWVAVSPASGSLAGHAHTTLTVSANPQGVTPGSYAAGLLISVNNGQSGAPVAIKVRPGAQLALTQQSLSFTQCGTPQDLTVANAGDAKLTYTAAPSQASALSVSPGSGSVEAGKKTTLSVMVNCGAPTGQKYAVILLSNGGSAQVAVTYGS